MGSIDRAETITSGRLAELVQAAQVEIDALLIERNAAESAAIEAAADDAAHSRLAAKVAGLNAQISERDVRIGRLRTAHAQALTKERSQLVAATRNELKKLLADRNAFAERGNRELEAARASCEDAKRKFEYRLNEFDRSITHAQDAIEKLEREDRAERFASADYAEIQRLRTELRGIDFALPEALQIAEDDARLSKSGPGGEPSQAAIRSLPSSQARVRAAVQRRAAIVARLTELGAEIAQPSGPADVLSAVAAG